MYESVVEFMVLWRSPESISQNRSKRGGAKHYNKSLCCHYLSLLISVTHSLPPFSLRRTVLVPRCICSFVISTSSPLLLWWFLNYFSLLSSQSFSLFFQQQAWYYKPRMGAWGGGTLLHLCPLHSNTGTCRAAYVCIDERGFQELVVFLPLACLCSLRILLTAAGPSCSSFPPDRWRRDTVSCIRTSSNLVQANNLLSFGMWRVINGQNIN